MSIKKNITSSTLSISFLAGCPAFGELDEDGARYAGNSSGVFEAANEPAETQFLEIQVSADEIVDFEFDWGRDGVHCGACNDGDGNARLVFTDRKQNLWLGYVDPDTGEFDPPDGRALLLDVNAAFATDFGNGPEWMFSTGPSEVVYTKYAFPKLQNAFTAGVAAATPHPAGGWIAGILPGGLKSHSPAATLDRNDPNPRINYQNHNKTNVFWADVTAPQAPGVPHLLPIGQQQGGGSRRWVPGTRSIVFTKRAIPDAAGAVHRQAFVYDTDSEVLEQLTFSPTAKWIVFMWRAPEYGDEYVFLTAASDRTQIKIYRQLPTWTEVNSIDMPAALPYLWSPEPFTYNGKSYILMEVSSSATVHDVTVPTHIAITGIQPEQPSFSLLTNDDSIPRLRSDPEHFITTHGAFIYYNRYIPATAHSPVVNDGVWRVDTELGPPQE